MRDPPFSSSKKSTIVVLGFYANRKGKVKQPRGSGVALPLVNLFSVNSKSTTPHKVIPVSMPLVNDIPNGVKESWVSKDVPPGFEG